MSVVAAESPLPHPDTQLPEEYEELLSTALTEAVLITGASSGHVALVDLENSELVFHQTVGEGWTPEKARLRIRIVNEEGRGIIARVATTGQPYRTGSAKEDPYYLQLFSNIESELCVPIIDRSERTIGVINLESSTPDAFDERDQELAAELAERCALALSAADFSARLQALVEIGQQLSEVRDTTDLLGMVADVATHILRTADCSIFLYTAGRDRLVLRASRGLLAQSIGDDPPSYAPGEGLTGWVAQNAQRVNTSSPDTDPRWKGLHSELPREQIGAFLAVPIVGRDEVFGVIRVVRRRVHGQAFVPDEFTEADEQLLWTLASQVGVSLENARLFDRALQSERLAAWGELSARAQHMIGNVVFGIKGHVGELDYVLSSGDPDREELQSVAARVRTGLYRLESIMQEFRDFVMATRLSPSDLDLNALVSETVRDTLSGQPEVRVELQLTEDLPTFRADSSKLRAALGELLENSVAAQSDSPLVRVGTDRATPADLRAFGLPSHQEGFVRVSVSDAGPGVDGTTRERIFQPFFSTKSQGMGLGLSIVRGIIEAHRGYIRELGEAGHGANFVILLPINAGPSSQSVADVGGGAATAHA